MDFLFSIRNQACPNVYCPLFHFQGQKNISIHSQKKRRFQCMICKRTWAAYAHEYYFGLRIAKEKVDSTLELLRQGESIRKIAQKMSLSPTTVQRWKLLL